MMTRLLRKWKEIFLSAFSYLREPRRTRGLRYLRHYGVWALVREIVFRIRNGILNHPAEGGSIPGQASFVREMAEINRRDREEAKKRLSVFLNSTSSFTLPVSDAPAVSVILLFFNRAEMSLQCLQSLPAGAGRVPFEVIIVDNASTDDTSALLDRIQNARIIRNSYNTGFCRGCNQAAEIARGEYLLFLNNDTHLLPDCLQVMIDTFREGSDIGAVGGKLIFPDGRLQEAGSLIFRDGSCLGYGRGDNPQKLEYSYARDVDFCSGAFLLTPKTLFSASGQFDPRYEPAYYEDADYCMQLQRRGYRVVFQPFAAAVHHEFGSLGREEAVALQLRNRAFFSKKWKSELRQFEPRTDRYLPRGRKSGAKRILFLDDRIPDYRLGSGYPRSYKILLGLSELGHAVTCFPMMVPRADPEISRSLRMKRIEVWQDETGRETNLAEFLQARPEFYDIVLISRPHNYRAAIGAVRKFARESAVIYDAEALFAVRELKYHELWGESVSDAEKEKLIQTEVDLTVTADAVIAVSEKEKAEYLGRGTRAVHVLGYAVDAQPTAAPFEWRKDILFVGGVLGVSSPNEDAIRHFAVEIFPRIRRELECDFYVLGANSVRAVGSLESDHIHVLGGVEDLAPQYDRSRLFVVPTRYSAGLPIKLLDAAAHGLPAVVTPITADQLGWREDHEYLVGHDDEDFAQKVVRLYSNRDLFYRLRENSLTRIRNEHHPESFRKALAEIIASAPDRRIP